MRCTCKHYSHLNFSGNISLVAISAIFDGILFAFKKRHNQGKARERKLHGWEKFNIQFIQLYAIALFMTHFFFLIETKQFAMNSIDTNYNSIGIETFKICIFRLPNFNEFSRVAVVYLHPKYSLNCHEFA